MKYNKDHMPDRIWLSRADYNSDFPDYIFDLDLYDDGGDEYIRADHCVTRSVSVTTNSAVEVCPVCDIAGCKHIREAALKKLSDLGQIYDNNGWQPIETAPRDGVRVLAADHSFVREMLFDTQQNAWVDTVEAYYKFEPSHWMPLPEPPHGKAGA